MIQIYGKKSGFDQVWQEAFIFIKGGVRICSISAEDSSFGRKTSALPVYVSNQI
jgi:hypothetical protein